MAKQNMDRQVFVIKTVAYRARTDKKVKSEIPITFSNDIFYFKTVMIIGGPISAILPSCVGTVDGVVGTGAAVVVDAVVAVDAVFADDVVVVVLLAPVDVDNEDINFDLMTWR